MTKILVFEDGHQIQILVCLHMDATLSLSLNNAGICHKGPSPSLECSRCSSLRLRRWNLWMTDRIRHCSGLEEAIITLYPALNAPDKHRTPVYIYKRHYHIHQHKWTTLNVIYRSPPMQQLQLPLSIALATHLTVFQNWINEDNRGYQRYSGT